MHHSEPPSQRPDLAPQVSRRQLLCRAGGGLGFLALAGALADDGAWAGDTPAAGPGAVNPLAERKPHFPAKAKRVIQIFLNGGPSHVDTFDPKPALAKYNGKPLPTENLRTERKTGGAFASPFRFQKYGESGIEVSELFQHTAAHIDDIAVVRSMYANVPNHEQSLLLMNCGQSQQVRPSMGSWLLYGLGTENQNLPGYVAMCPKGYPVAETQNWQSAFLPGIYQGTFLESQHKDLEKLLPNIRNGRISRADQRRQLDVLAALNRRHQQERPADADLEARIQSFELAYRMQIEASDAFDVSREPQHVLDAYGPGQHARQLLLARRLVERGVRFVQLFHGSPQPWDNHTGLKGAHEKLARQIDQPTAALIADLKRLGMFEETLILWGGEFGRTPTMELPGGKVPSDPGRDHNHWGFTVWLAGGGVRGGQAYGATDEFGFKAAENRVHVHDLHATMLHLLGFDHTRLTYRYAGRDFRLTDVHGEVIRDLVG